MSILSAIQEIQEALKQRLNEISSTHLGHPSPLSVGQWKSKILRAHHDVKQLAKDTHMPLLHNQLLYRSMLRQTLAYFSELVDRNNFEEVIEETV